MSFYTYTKLLQKQAAAQKQTDIENEIKRDPEDRFKYDSLDSSTEVSVDNITTFDPIDTISEKIKKNKDHPAAPDSEEEEEKTHHTGPRP